MRDGWNLEPLGDIISPIETIDPRKQPDICFNYIDVSCVSKDTQTIESFERTKGSKAPSRARRVVRSNDVLFATIRPTLKRIALVGTEYNESVCSTGFIVLRPRPLIDSRFLYYYLGSDFFISKMGSLERGASYPAVSDSDVKNHVLPVPPLSEQKEIVAILDEAFAAIDVAKANTEKNLANAREVFESHLNRVFEQNNETGSTDEIQGPYAAEITNKRKSNTKGRQETDRIIEGELSLSVGYPKILPKKGWKWAKLSDLATLESGHTPSRRHPEYWEGKIPWIGIKDAKSNHGMLITETINKTNQLGIDNSATRLLPKNTVCLSRTASVGYVTVLGAEMCTSQDFVNWICGPSLDPHYLKYLLIAEGEGFSRYSSGAVHQTIYFPEVKAFHICYPPVQVQKKLVKLLDKSRKESEKLALLYQKKIDALDELKQSLLHKAFTGELTAKKGVVEKELEGVGV